MDFVKLANGNVIMGGSRKLSANCPVIKDTNNANNVIIIDPVLGRIPVNYTQVTAPVSASRDELFTKLVTDFFF